MALVKLNPTSDAVNNTTTSPEVLQKPHQSTFTALVSEAKINSLLKYTEGYPWSCHYYGQIIDRANTLEHVDPEAPSLLNPYYEIIDLILQVQTPLTSSHDERTGVTTISGSAIMPYKSHPNVGDFFIAQVDNNEDAICVVHTVERLTYRKDTLYQINYVLWKYVSGEPVFLENLKKKVQDTYYFNKDTNFFNRDHLITPSVKEATDRLKTLLRQTQESYFRMFSQKGVSSILIPGVTEKVYDPHLVGFVGKIVDHDIKISHPWYQYTFYSQFLEQPSFYDYFLQRSTALHTTINKRFTFVNTAQLARNARMGSIFHAGINQILYPIEPDGRTVIGRYPELGDATCGGTWNGVLTEKNYNGSTLNVKTKNNNTTEEKKLLHPLFEGDFYVVTQEFYDLISGEGIQPSVSFVEMLLARFIRREAIAREDLVVALENYHQWSLLHQLYLLPLFWVMIKSAG